MWDYQNGLVRITPFFKACKHSKVCHHFYQTFQLRIPRHLLTFSNRLLQPKLSMPTPASRNSLTLSLVALSVLKATGYRTTALALSVLPSATPSAGL